MDNDPRQDRRDERREKDRNRMVVHKVKSPRAGERLVKLMVGRTRKAKGLKPRTLKLRTRRAA